jgi:hypothetical protein
VSYEGQSVKWLAVSWTIKVWFLSRAETFLFSTPYRPALGLSQLPVKWVLQSLFWA